MCTYFVRHYALFLAYSFFVLSFSAINTFAGDYSNAAIISHLVTANVFGANDKYTVHAQQVSQAPYKFIGRFEKGCTGSLISRNMVLTAAHCVFDNNGVEESKENLVFSLGYLNDNNNETYNLKSDTQILIFGSNRASKEDRSKDWAIVKLLTPVDADYGFFRISNSPSLFREVIYQAGYGNGFEGGGKLMSAHSGCHIKAEKEGLLYHDCDTTRGDSGSPLFVCPSNKNGQCFIIGIHVASNRDESATSLFLHDYTEDYGNQAVKISTIIDRF